jgi:hypothetical protein
MPARVPWYVWTSLASISCIVIGTYWDISWHMTIGRDTFWTPAHLAIQAGGIIAGTSGTYLIVTTTLRRTSPLRDASVRVWGFRGPLGAFLAVWGAATMVVSAPFDNWWHAAYGLDVKILSPPHAVLTLGILGVAIGGTLQIVSANNRARQRVLELAVLAVGGMVMILSMTALLELTFRSNLHRASAYIAMSIVVPLVTLAFSRVSDHRWAATIVAGTYMAFLIAMLWLFPLFPAEAKLGPVYQPITHYIPHEFPPLVIVPAFMCDVVRARVRWRRLALAPLLGIVFLVALVAAEWPFADFLMTEHARNWVFGTHYLPYMMQPGWYEARYEFMPDANIFSGLAMAAVVAIVTSYVGLVLGDAMRRTKR